MYKEEDARSITAYVLEEASLRSSNCMSKKGLCYFNPPPDLPDNSHILASNLGHTVCAHGQAAKSQDILSLSALEKILRLLRLSPHPRIRTHLRPWATGTFSTLLPVLPQSKLL